MHYTGSVIRAARKAQNLSMRQLGELADVNPSTISRIERGTTDPSPRVVKALTDALGRNLATLRNLGGAA